VRGGGSLAWRSCWCLLILFLFLQDCAPQVVPILAIPISLIGTFAFVNSLLLDQPVLNLLGVVLGLQAWSLI